MKGGERRKSRLMRMYSPWFWLWKWQKSKNDKQYN
jgi:hypothetical protein